MATAKRLRNDSGERRKAITVSNVRAAAAGDVAKGESWDLERLDTKKDLNKNLLTVAREVRVVIDRYLHQHSTKRLLDAFSRKGQADGCKSVAVVSLLSGEGRTFLAAVLARGLAQCFSARVLLVDGSGNAAGQCVLSGAADSVDGVAVDSKSASGGFCKVVFPFSNPQYPQDDFRLGELIKSIEAQFDYVIVDTPALTATGVDGFDATVIARQLDATVAILTPESSNVRQLHQLRDCLTACTVPCIGFVTRTDDVQRGSR